ncbi:MAG: FtsX-like permease family protein [Promethearchaeota archaeon]
MAFRLFKKAVLMSLREKKQFTVFCLMYTILIFWTSYSIELISAPEGSNLGIGSFFLAIGVGVFLSLLYAWIIVSRNRRTWATLKCVGYTNGDINSLVSGFILFTTIMGFFIVIEVLFHYVAILGYIQSANESTAHLVSNLPLISLIPVVVTFFIFLSIQILAILVANRRILKVRPIIALKKVGE